MINPSTSGWIDKFFYKQKFSEQTVAETAESFYNKVRDTGFIYGHIISFETQNAIPTKGWFKEEISKVALLNTLFGVYALTKKETMLLKLLIERKNEAVSREQILETVWNYDVYPSTRTIDNFILTFRKYFEPDQKNPVYFHSIRGVGYKFTDSH